MSDELEAVCQFCGGSMSETGNGPLSYRCNTCGKHTINPLLGIPKDKILSSVIDGINRLHMSNLLMVHEFIRKVNSDENK